MATPVTRLTPELIKAVVDLDLDMPPNGATPRRVMTRVTLNNTQYDVPTVVAHVFVAGSGPIGCTFARNLLDRTDENKRPSVTIAEIGSQEGAIKGRNLKNSLKYQKDIDAFVHVIQGHLQPISVVPTHPVLNMYGNNPSQERDTNLPASAVTRTVGGMATHWTCCCPKPDETAERNQSPIGQTEFDSLFDQAGKYLTVDSDAFNQYIRHTIVKGTLTQALPAVRSVGNLPLGVRRPTVDRNYLTWAGADTVLEITPRGGVATVADEIFWMTETRVTRLVKATSGTSISAVVLRDYNSNSDVLVIAKHFIVACGAVGTPQVLHNSDIRPPALGRYLSEQSIAFCQIVLKRTIFDSDTYLNDDQKAKRTAHIKANPRDVPIPLEDLEPQVYLPYIHDTSPWHVQIHRDAFSYGDVGPTADPRLIVDLRFFGKADLSRDNRVHFPSQDASGEAWRAGDRDIYGMPQPTFHVTRSPADLERDNMMMKDMKAVARILGEYLPGSEPQFMAPGLALHITGTTRMTPRGTAPEEARNVSVVDENSKVHDYSNLWLGGCNVIPDSMACNPTRTAVAYAIKSASAVHALLYPDPAR